MWTEAGETAPGGYPVAGADGRERRVVSPVLVGRNVELSALLSALAALPAVAVVEGEAGVGKTRLVAELSSRVEVSGLRCLRGRCLPVREPFPLGPVIEAVRGLGTELGGLVLSPVVGALRPLLPELSDLLPPGLDPMDDRAAQRYRMFRGLVEMLAAAGPAVLVVEDVHWVDQQTADFLTYLIAELPPRLAVVLTYRGEEASPAIRALSARLGADVTQARVRLLPLDEDRAGALIAAILGVDSVSAEFSAYLWERTSGLPLAVEEVLALVRARGLLVRHGGRWERKALDEIEVPSGIRDSTLERIARLSASARRVVQACAVLHDVVALDVVYGMVKQAEIQDGYDEAVESGLLTEISGKVGVRHRLAAQAVYEDLGSAGKRRLHGKAADVLLTLDVVPLGQVAHHLRLAGRLDEWARTAELAADRAIELGDDAEATRLLDVVVREAPLSEEQRGRIAAKLGRAAMQTLHTRELVGLLSGVLEQELPQVVRGELRYYLAAAVHQNGDGDPHVYLGLLARAVDELDDRPDVKARALVALGLLGRMQPADAAVAASAGWIERSLALAGETGDGGLEQFVAGKTGSALMRDGDPDWRRMVDRVMEIKGGAPRHRDEVNLYCTLGDAAVYVGHFATAATLLAEAARAAAALNYLSLDGIARVGRAFLAYRCGQWIGLAAEVEGLLAEFAEARGFRLAVETVAACLALAGGAVEEARARLEDTLEAALRVPDPDPVPVAADAAVRAALHRGDVDGAVTLARRCVSWLTDNGDWPHAVQLLPAAVSALRAAGREAEARDLIDRVERAVRDKDAPLGPACVRHAVGLLTASAEDLHAAAGMYEAAGLPYEAARADEQAARCLLDRGESELASPVLLSVVAAYERLGASWDRARAAGLARHHDVGLPSVHRGGHRGYGERLSPRERQVAALAAAGLTNNEIATELFVTRKTVEKQLTAAMRKLNLRSRTELARQWDHLAEGGVRGSESGGIAP